jgi:hypothetical protein
MSKASPRVSIWVKDIRDLHEPFNGHGTFNHSGLRNG